MNGFSLKFCEFEVLRLEDYWILSTIFQTIHRLRINCDVISYACQGTWAFKKRKKKGSWFSDLYPSHQGSGLTHCKWLPSSGKLCRYASGFEFGISLEVKTRFMLSGRVRNKIGSDYRNSISGLTPTSSNTPDVIWSIIEPHRVKCLSSSLIQSWWILGPGIGRKTVISIIELFSGLSPGRDLSGRLVHFLLF